MQVYIPMDSEWDSSQNSLNCQQTMTIKHEKDVVRSPKLERALEDQSQLGSK